MINPVILRQNIHQELKIELEKLQKCADNKVGRSLTANQLEKVIAKLAQGFYLDMFVAPTKEGKRRLQKNFQETVASLTLALDRVYA